ncbi:uncharacterized protein LOC103978887 [Musa acuminata AAA Group]|uniref:uncharacterized protein LOC103978887 n=1 Tax=Musa acuminata AAA Group TaxID=214697 RepID=UPI0031DD2617
MDFLKTVFSADPEPSQPHDDDYRRGEGGGASEWSFGGFIKTLASMSESVIQTYRRDLAEFGTGLKKETEAVGKAAARAFRDLDGSVWRGTGEEAVETGDDSGPTNTVSSSRRYSRFDVELLTVQSEVRTFSEDPEEAEDFSKWRSEFDLVEKEEEIENLCRENGALLRLLNKLVPGVVEYETFWFRYYYRVRKLKQAEDARAKLVRRMIRREEELEELSWEVDDDDEGDEEELETEENKEEKKDREAKSTCKSDEAVVAEGSCKDGEFLIISTQNSVSEEDDLGWDEIEDLGEHDEMKGGGSVSGR